MWRSRYPASSGSQHSVAASSLIRAACELRFVQNFYGGQSNNMKITVNVSDARGAHGAFRVDR